MWLRIISVLSLALGFAACSGKVSESPKPRPGLDLSGSINRLLILPFSNRSEHPKADAAVLERMALALKNNGVAVKMLASAEDSDENLVRPLVAKKLNRSWNYALSGSVIEYGYRGTRPVVALSLRIYDLKRGDYIWAKNFAASGNTFSFQSRPSADQVLQKLAEQVSQQIGGAKKK